MATPDNTTEPREKVTVKLWKTTFRLFNAVVRPMPINRDRLIDVLIADQIPHLRNDMAGRQLSRGANRYISGQLKRLGLVNVTLALRPATADALRKVVLEHGLVRDAFINRLLLLAAGDHRVLYLFDLPTDTGARVLRHAPPFATAPIATLQEVFGDPFLYLRMACQETEAPGLYVRRLRDKLVGLSCWLPDSEVPKTDAWKEREEEEAELLRSLGDLASILDSDVDTPGGADSRGET